MVDGFMGLGFRTIGVHGFYGLILALVLFGGGPALPPPPARIRNGGRQIKRMIGAPGIQ